MQPLKEQRPASAPQPEWGISPSKHTTTCIPKYSMRICSFSGGLNSHFLIFIGKQINPLCNQHLSSMHKKLQSWPCSWLNSNPASPTPVTTASRGEWKQSASLPLTGTWKLWQILHREGALPAISRNLRCTSSLLMQSELKHTGCILCRSYRWCKNVLLLFHSSSGWCCTSYMLPGLFITTNTTRTAKGISSPGTHSCRPGTNTLQSPQQGGWSHTAVLTHKAQAAGSAALSHLPIYTHM